MSKKIRLLITCEHGGNQVPSAYADCFSSSQAKEILKTHRGWDPGTLELASMLRDRFNAPMYQSETTRLLVDLNRSLRRRTLFSEFTKPLSKESKNKILETYYHPHRNAITHWVGDKLKQGFQIVHIACHSFTPVLNGVVRQTDIGFLYDPSWTWEVQLCSDWKKRINERAPQFRVRFNYPYLGKNDGLTTHLRKSFPKSKYAGIELEVNQKFPQDLPQEWSAMKDLLIETIEPMLCC